MEEKRINTDVLVIGGAGAGLRAAIEARANGVDVILASKMPAAGTSSTLLIAGWITCSTPANGDELFRQIVYTGGYLNNQKLVEVLVKDAIHRIPELRDFGVPLEVREGDAPDMPGHYMVPRIADQPKGYALMQPMRNKAESMGVIIMDNTPISTLITVGDTVVGAVGIDLNTNQLVVISAKSVVLATGGGAFAFERSDNPPGITGDGFSLAYQAGAELIDMECISLNLPRNLLPEVFKVKEEPPENLISVGTAHYFLGGVKIDEECKTNIHGLYAAGEVSGGLLGAARLGGSAVADIIVFGARAGRSAALRAKSARLPDLNMPQVDEEKDRLKRITERNIIPPIEILAKVKSILWRYMGAVKSEYTLNKGLEKLSRMKTEVFNLRARNSEELLAAIEASNILELGRIIATASLIRKETRGNFWRADYPQPDNNNWIKNVVVFKDGEDIKTRLDEVVMTRLHSPTEPPVGAGCFWYFPRMKVS